MNECKEQLISNVLSTVEDIEEGNIYDILDCALDVEYTIDSRGNFLGSIVTTSTGGPHIEINTRYDKVVGYWGSDRIERSYTDNIGLHEYTEQCMPVMQTHKY